MHGLAGFFEAKLYKDIAISKSGDLSKLSSQIFI
jgi:hypothetical protein